VVINSENMMHDTPTHHAFPKNKSTQEKQDVHFEKYRRYPNSHHNTVANDNICNIHIRFKSRIVLWYIDSNLFHNFSFKK